MTAAAAVDNFLDNHQNDLLRLTERLISIDSQIPPFADEQEIAEEIRTILSALGLGEAKILGPSPERPSIVLRVAGVGGGKNLLLNGHIDTKPVGNAASLWKSDPFVATHRDGNIYGLGSVDMKAAVAAMIYAAVALKETQTPLQGDLVLCFVADEEAGATYGAKYLAPLLHDIDAAIVGEPSGITRDWEGIHLVSRGVCCFRVTVHGTQKHSSLSDRLPSINASTKMAELMLKLDRELKFTHTPHPLGNISPTLNTGVTVRGGTFFGVISGEAEFAVDVRTVPGMTQESLRKDLEEFLARAQEEDPELQVSYAFEEGLEWVPWSELQPDNPLVESVQLACEEVLGEAPPLSVFPGGTDAPWFEAAGIPTLPSFGPGIITSAHGPNEFISVSSILEAAKIYARTAAHYCNS